MTDDMSMMDTAPVGAASAPMDTEPVGVASDSDDIFFARDPGPGSVDPMSNIPANAPMPAWNPWDKDTMAILSAKAPRR